MRNFPKNLSDFAAYFAGCIICLGVTLVWDAVVFAVALVLTVILAALWVENRK